MSISAIFHPAAVLLDVDGDSADDTIIIGNTGNGTIFVNGSGGAVLSAGGVPTVFNTAFIQVSGGGGNDTLLVNDFMPRASLFGGSGNDRLVGGTAADRLVGGTGDDVLAGRGGHDTYSVDSAADTVSEAANQGTDTVEASVSHALQAHFETLVLTGNGAIDGTGNGLGNTLTGNAGNNVLTGGLGRDTMSGFGGADTFVFGSIDDSTVAVSGRDTITGFKASQGDRLDLRLIDAASTVDGDQAFTFIGDGAFSQQAGQLRAVFEGGSTVVSGDVNGDGGADFAFALEGKVALTQGEFLL